MRCSTASVIASWNIASKRVGGERAQALERLAHLGQVVLGTALVLERLPDLLDEEVDEGAGDGVGLLSQLAGDVERRLGRDTQRSQLLAGSAQPRAQLLVVAVADRAHDPQLLCAAEHLAGLVAGVGKALGELLGADDLRLLVFERRLDRAGEAQHLLARAAGAVEQPADRLELEAVGLELADELDPSSVRRPVEPGAPADVGGREQTA